MITMTYNLFQKMEEHRTFPKLFHGAKYQNKIKAKIEKNTC